MTDCSTSSHAPSPPSMFIPELRLEVAAYFQLRDLCACALVCRAWNDSYTPLLYHMINDKNVTSPGVKRHCVHARTLNLVVGSSRVENLLAGPTVGLKEMDITDKWVFHGLIPSNWVILLQQNTGLVRLTLRMMRPSTMDAIVSLCPNLQELSIHDHRVQPSRRDITGPDTSLRRICLGLTHLLLAFTASPKSSRQGDYEQEEYPVKRHLTIGALRLAGKDQLQLLAARTNMETLDNDWQRAVAGDAGSGLDLNLSTRLFQSLPKLRELEINVPLSLYPGSLGQNWTRGVIGGLPLLKEYIDPESRPLDDTEGLVEGPLSRHFGTLTVLNIRGWKEVTSENNHLILTSCPGLREFSSKDYRIGDISWASPSAFDPKSGPLGWVCTLLSEISLEFTHETPERSRLMFDQLCCMKKLACVNLQGPKSGLDPILIQWDDDVPARFWRKGPSILNNNVKATNQWIRAIWPKMRSFSTYV
ncbi:hypothetical protein EMPS_07342 [Entomortierella parvispora]|uniref:F-box domain-containing protein n=1 Tax=Entomortierella parvispora TaxID=205924 RepID=A0A9P3HE38_9FUNG|nr:hypothetical protein EMPS_07342 [Entomortierella parvispora]